MTTTITIEPHAQRITFTEADTPPDYPMTHQDGDGTLTVSGLPTIDDEHQDRIQDHLAPLMANIATGNPDEATHLIHRAAYEPLPPSLSPTEREVASRGMHAAVDAWVRGSTDSDVLIVAISTAAGVVSHGVREREEYASIAQGRAPYAYCGVFLGSSAPQPPQCSICAEIADQDERNAEVFDELMGGDR